jgi:mycothiol synthase
MIAMELVLPDGLECRPLRMDEAPAVAELAAACEQHFLDEAFVEEADLAGEWARPSMDFAADTRGVYEDGLLVAGAELDHREQIYVDVRPSHLGRGIGSALGDWALGLAMERRLSQVNQLVPTSDLAGAEILRARGYRPAYTDWFLRMDPEVPLIRHELPEAVTIDAFTTADASAVHEVIEEAFSSWAGRAPRTYDDWAQQNLQREGTDPSTFRVARAGGDVIGVCVVHDGEGKAWVHQLAVSAAWRGHGIGQELLAETYAAGRARGLPVGELSTDSRTGALGLYERLGMRIVAQLENWTKQLA